MLNDILSACNLSGSVIRHVIGGDINQSYQIRLRNDIFFLKVNNAGLFPDMFKKESAGLSSLQHTELWKVPLVVKEGVVDTKQYLLLEWIEKGNPKVGFWENFGNALAVLHKTAQPYFGFSENNYIGSLLQRNTPTASWDEFYSHSRIMPLVKELFDDGKLSQADIISAERFCSRISEIFPKENPALLHGDLWSGNFMVAADGYVAVYDPAVYYGHREMDIGMTALFGGFDKLFYDAYNKSCPLEKGWQDRLIFTQLYPLLVHSVLFGGHYICDVKDIIHPFGK